MVQNVFKGIAVSQSNEEEIVELILEEEMGEVIQFGRSGAD